MLWKGFPCGPAVLMKVSAMSWNVVADFFARASAYSFPMIPAWDLSLKKWMGDGDWQTASAMDWRTSPWMWWRWRIGCESCFFIWCSGVRLSVAICE